MSSLLLSQRSLLRFLPGVGAEVGAREVVVARGPFCSVLGELLLITSQFGLTKLESLTALVHLCERDLASSLVGLILWELVLEVKPVLSSTTRFLTSEVLLVANSLGGGKVLIETGVGHVRVGGLIVLLVICVSVTVFPPVAVKSLRVE